MTHNPTREEARALLDRIVLLYQGHAAAANPPGTHRLLATFVETDTFPHISADAKGEEWTVSVTPSWLDVPGMNLDVLALTACHEVGHLVGGFPFKGADYRSEDGTDIANEAQADYFATKDCLPRLWADETAFNAAVFDTLDPYKRELCTKAYSDAPTQALCGRLLLASLQTAPIVKGSDAGGSPPPPQIETPDTSVIAKTARGKVPVQCRLDTMVAGALCSVKQTGTIIPGFVPPYGSKFSTASELAARPFACQDGPGARPKCWFHPDWPEYDCTGFETPSCIIHNESPAFFNCNSRDGVEYVECSLGEVCRMEETENGLIPNCFPADESSL